jgi:hypothetical protein
LSDAIILLILIASAVVTGCGSCRREAEKTWLGHAEHCIDHVTYLEFEAGSIVKRDTLGDIVPCDLPLKPEGKVHGS